MPRTTLNLDPTVLRELRRRSFRQGKTMGQVASELLALVMAEPTVPPTPDFMWAAADLGLPHVELEDREAVRREIDAEDPFG